MSCTETNIGKLTPIHIGVDAEKAAEIVLEEITGGPVDADEDYGCSTYLEALQEETDYEQYFAHGGQLYKVDMKTSCDDTLDVSEASQNADGTISFTLQYYNGGCCFSEAMASAMDKIPDPEPVRTQEQRLLPICVAYEQGYGDGVQGKHEKCNPYPAGSDEAWAHDYGKKEGTEAGAIPECPMCEAGDEPKVMRVVDYDHLPMFTINDELLPPLTEEEKETLKPLYDELKGMAQQFDFEIVLPTAPRKRDYPKIPPKKIGRI